MTDKKTEALKLALENICAAKLCEFNSMSSRHEMIRLMDAAITVIREALAEQPAQQCLHVGDSQFESWFSEYNPAGKGTKQQMREAYATGMRDPLVQPAQQQEPTDCDDPFAEIYDEAKKGTEAYTAPPPQRQTLPDGIPSPDELEALSDGNDGMLLNEGFPEKLDRLARWLREYAAAPAPLAEQPAQQQEPVAVVKALPMGHNQPDMHYAECQHLPVGTPLYTSPPASKPWVSLTDEEVRAVRDSFGDEPVMLIAFARAIEAKLREKNA